MSKEGVAAPELERVLTPKVMVVGVVLSVLLSVVSLSVAAFLIPGNMLKLGDLVGPINTGIPSLALSFGIVSLAAIPLGRIKMDPRKYAVVYSMILVSTIYASGWGYPMTVLPQIAQVRVNTGIAQNFGPYTPSWVPSTDVFTGMYVGGTAVPWAAWTTPLLMLWTGALITYFLWVSLYNIFRRQWIDVERMEFVWAQVHTMTILNATPGQKERSDVKHFILRKRFAIALIIGAIFELQMALNIMYPWFPAVTAAWSKWPWVSWHPGTLDFGVAVGPAWFDGLPGWTGIIFGHPVIFAIAFLVPVDVLLATGIFDWIQSALIPMILSFMGMVPKPAFPGGGSRYGLNAWWYGSALGPGNPYLGAVVSNLGFWMALGFFPLVLGGNWRYIVNTLRSVRKGPSAEERENEPMPYRWAWIIFAVMIMLFLVWGYGFLGLGLGAGILWVGYWSFTQLAFVRMKAVGAVTRELADDWMAPPYYFRMTYPPFGGLPTTFADLNAIYPNPDAVSSYAVQKLQGLQGFMTGNSGICATNTFAETYKIGANVGVKPRDMFRSVTVASLVVMSISLPMGLWFYYTYGIKPEGLAYEWSLGGSAAGAWTIPGYAWVGMPAAVGWKVWAAFLISFFGMGAMVWLRSHFVWFPLSPVGAAIGVTPLFTWVGWGYTFFVTYFLKRLALRIGGVRFYEDWITPVAIGFIVGYGLGVLLWGVASIVRFLYV